MGRFDCDRHGVGGMKFACPHIAGDLRAGKRTPSLVYCGFSDENGDPNFKVVLSLVYCGECVEKHAFPSTLSMLPEGQFREMYAKGFVPVCFKCFAELNQEPHGEDSV